MSGGLENQHNLILCHVNVPVVLSKILHKTDTKVIITSQHIIV